ncbi:uncharacterized protein BKCO1_900033 [Diplodia corticola]|uniref:Uncharacterized protein n=1 Tax=Diplodia corticola TaxID=236234 RepID=A0A1J9R9U1_9PEZI|nr:uncharacterized protein BKCO1_900033 [Diplodia corticola]OJD36946.1 hypothetical protein BKCO1_900033 [Diplodia corticola]
MPPPQQLPDRATPRSRTRILADPIFHRAFSFNPTPPTHRGFPTSGGNPIHNNSTPTNDDIAELTIRDIENFTLSYLRNEYSPRPFDHGPVRAHNPAATPITGASSHTLLNNLPTTTTSSPSPGRTMPANPTRWAAIGRCLRSHDPTTNTPTAATLATAATNPSTRRALGDSAQLRTHLVARRAPLASIEQLEAAVKDFSRLGRFSRVRTKLARAGAFAALAARLLRDQALLGALWPPPGPLVLPRDPVARAGRDLQAAGAEVFVRVDALDDYVVRGWAVWKCRWSAGRGVGGLMGKKKRTTTTTTPLGALRVGGQRLHALQIAENPAGACWGHTHREYMAADDLLDIGRGERLVRKIEFTRECNDCGVKHRHEVQLVVGPGEEMPREGELPAYDDLEPLQEQQQEQMEEEDEVAELYAQAEAEAQEQERIQAAVRYEAGYASDAESSSGVESGVDDETDSDLGFEFESELEAESLRPLPLIIPRAILPKP